MFDYRREMGVYVPPKSTNPIRKTKKMEVSMKDQEPVVETLGFLQFGNAEKRGLVLNQGFRKEHITCQASNTCR